MDYFKKGNSKMLVIICPTTEATQAENLNAVLRVVELSGGAIFEPDKCVEDLYYGVIEEMEEQRAADIQDELEQERISKLIESGAIRPMR